MAERPEDALRRFGYDPDHPVGRDDAIPERLIRRLHKERRVSEDVLSLAPVRSSTVLLGRELEVLRYLSHGLTVAMAADAIGIGLETARTHLKTARVKLAAKTKTAAVAAAIRQGLID